MIEQSSKPVKYDEKPSFRHAIAQLWGAFF
jgi:hypothetical protein